MSTELVEPAHPTRQLRRAIRQEIRRARQGLGERLADVHTARRALKRARALVRLGRDGWQADDRHRLQRTLRDAGRHAGPARDAEAVVEAVGRLTRHPELPCIDALELLRDRLVWIRDRTTPEPASDTPMDRARGELRAARRLLGHHPPRGRGRGMEVFHGGLLRILERGAEALEAARAHPDDPVAHHRVRKRAKDLRHALEFLQPVWPPILGAWTAELHRLTDRLGDGNDLTVVLRHVDARSDLRAGLDVPDLVSAIRDVRAARWAAGLALAGRIWTPPPDDFARDVIAWARAWHGPES